MNSAPNSSRKASELNCKLNINQALQVRQLGYKPYIGFSDDLISQLYHKIDKYQLNSRKPGTNYGGVFNLEYSLDGRLLVAACEHSCVLIYDSSSQKLLKTINKAHHNCVNCIRFLDDRTFATCSDDNTIKLWDIRNVNKGEMKTLHGHSNWVKNIEFSAKDNIMVTSAFDGSIYAWDLKSPTENSMLFDKVFLMSGLMRMKLTPDGTKMIISTTGGYIIIIHDLNLSTLANDFKTFKPNLYRLMQTSGQSFPAGTVFNHLFHPSRRRNRIEFIDDFTINADIISSLQIHPHGWNAVSRCLNDKETEEVTSVHDIQERDLDEYDECFKYYEGVDLAQSTDSDEDNDQRPTDLWMGYIPNYLYTSDRQSQPNVFENFTLPAMSLINSGLIGTNNYEAYFQDHPDDRNKVIDNLPRLTHFIEEQNLGKGYIKELCYSPDGRIICSPFGKGIRLLSFNESCQELTYCVPDQPKQLRTVLEFKDYHSKIVVCCKFNPNDMQLVSGCLNGDIIWYKPVL